MRAYRLRLLTLLLLALVGSLPSGARRAVAAGTAGPTLPHPLLFVTQVPIPDDFTTIGSVFGNHLATMQSAGRGGDLWIRYPDGTLKNLTAAAGYGTDGMQGDDAIAVRDPSVHWSGTKALFSMVVGAPTRQYATTEFYWQIYEITGLGPADTPTVRPIANQPVHYNNITPIYGRDDRILFTSDRPRSGERHLYPQRDEYEEAATVTGIWSLDEQTGDLFLLNHAPSGDFTPIVDSFGRVVFTQWDHLQRDQQADGDNESERDGGACTYCTFNYADESAQAAPLVSRAEVYPEPRADFEAEGTNLTAHVFNHFFPWTIAEDGTNAEVLNHLGRHELHGYIAASFTDDSNLVEYYGQYTRFNANSIQNLLQIREDPTHPGRYFGVDAPEFATHAAGQIVRLDAPPQLDADHIAVVYVTHAETSSPDDTPSPDHSGLYRDPLPLADGRLAAVHTAETRGDENEGDRATPRSRYDFRLKLVEDRGDGVYVAGPVLTGGISETVRYWDPDVLVTYSGALWELQPVEVRARPRPQGPAGAGPLLPPEQQIFDELGIDVASFQTYLRQNDLAIAVVRDVTSRDDMDRQQPFNLQVRDGVRRTTGTGKLYEVAYLQMFQADLIRGLTFGGDGPVSGRRVLAQPLHDPAAVAANLLDPDVPGAVEIAPDGSVALFVPARRAMTWQLTDGAGSGVVRERYWVTFQPGEIRVCGSCHGLNQQDQIGQGPPQNSPEALRRLLQTWDVPIIPQTELYLPALTR